MEESTQKDLEEWKVAMDNARHFNDLLIRFRMLGLPMVITIAVAGIASMGLGNIMTLWKWTNPLIAWPLALFSIVYLGLHTCPRFRAYIRKEKHEEEDKKSQAPPLTFYRRELFIWWIFFLLLLAFAIVITVQLVLSRESLSLSNTALYPVTPAVLGGSLLLLVALYFTDRFYYYKLLLGAVSRATELEQSLGFKVTARTTDFISRREATEVVSVFYGIPAIILLVATLLPMVLVTP